MEVVVLILFQEIFKIITTVGSLLCLRCTKEVFWITKNKVIQVNIFKIVDIDKLQAGS